MGEFAKYIPPDEVARRHRAARRPTGPANRSVREGDQPSRIRPRDKNVEAVLSLGSTRYFTFRNRVFGVPPLPFQAGQRILDTYVETLSLARDVVQMNGGERTSAEYYHSLARLARLLWKHTTPTKPWRRVFRRMGILRNPFFGATEGELKELTDFFLQGRMKSSVQFTRELNPAVSIPMSSTNSRSS